MHSLYNLYKGINYEFDPFFSIKHQQEFIFCEYLAGSPNPPFWSNQTNRLINNILDELQATNLKHFPKSWNHFQNFLNTQLDEGGIIKMARL